jgi:cystathionine beta-lyase/cystathionine gamma-synthase
VNPDSSDLGVSRPLIPPIFQASVYTIPDLDALDRIMESKEPGFIYARDGQPNAASLAMKLAALHNAPWGLVTNAGMAAHAACLLALTQHGDRVVASDKLYGRTSQLLQQELSRFGVVTDWVDVTDVDAVRRALTEPARVLLVETVSNPLLRVADLDALGDIAYSRGVKLVVDNTFATPILVKPLDRNADLVVESLTKMIGGHSDLTLGFIAGEDDTLLPALTQCVSIWGLAANPFDCWLAERGIATLELRMRTATANAAALADWLEKRSGVLRVIYPGRRDHPDYALARKLMPDGPGNMVCIELDGGREAVNRFLRRANGIPFSPSLGHTGTTVSYPAGTSHRFVSPAERKRQGIGDGLIRLSIGFEPIEQIQREVARGLG